MMSKGQLSFDLMMAILAMLVFVGSLQTNSESFNLSSQKMAILEQERDLALKLEQINAMAFALSDGNYFIEFKIPYFNDPTKIGLQDCNIFFVEVIGDANYLEVYYLIGDENISVKKKVGLMHPDLIDNYALCGDEIILRRGT